MAWPLPQPAVLMASVVLGGWLGHRLGLQRRVDHWLQAARARSDAGPGQAAMSATLLFNVGALAILAALQAGTSGSAVLFETKAVLDGFTAMLLTIAQGWGVLLAAGVTILYEGSLTLAAHALGHLFGGAVLRGFTATGGIVVMAIGWNFLSDSSTFALADLLPALPLAVAGVWVSRHFALW